LIGCESEKDRDRLKEAFFCTINGEEFYPKKLISNEYAIYYNEKIIVTSTPSRFIIDVSSNRFRSAHVIISLTSTKNPIGVGEYILKDSYYYSDLNFDFNDKAYGYCYFQDKNEKEIIYIPDKYNYSTTLDANGYVNITNVNLVEKTITGSFNFTAVNKKGDVLSVQNGRFNTKYK
jgi:hypothetical protein